MGKPPAVVIIARHGARIDAVDKEWHLTSPTPYDPPLTYGGWTQGRALGARIASLLQAREETMHDDPSVASSSSGSGYSPMTEETTPDQNPHPRRIRKHKVIIHSSPYLRCIQSAIAISAGMSQFHRASNDQATHDESGTPRPDSEDVSPATTPAATPADKSVQPATDHEKHNHHVTHHRTFPRPRLRIDAFLGEWLSPDYYDQITPPPGSVMMVASAKSELLRRGEGIQRTHDAGSRSLSGHFPGGWRSSSNPSTPDIDDDAGKFRNLSSIATALPQLGAKGSPDPPHGRSGKPITIRDVLSRGHHHANEDFSDGYLPPVPSYAISPSDPIPAGYVAHARDACVDVDYQWDSMRDPQNWGNGGEYGEEWSGMHLRFRNGLIAMLDWYRDEHPYHHNHHYHHHHESKDEPTDTVLVLITHGAGCNALIGALTNQPVLLDVAMASLTMAVRKDILKGKDAGQFIGQGEEQRHQSHVENSISEEYDMSLIASTEHLQAGSSPLSIPQLPSPSVPPMPHIPPRVGVPAYHHRFDSSVARFRTDTLYSPSPRGVSLQRSATTNSAHSLSHRNTAAAAAATHSAAGLWGTAAPSESVIETPVESDRERDEIVPNANEYTSTSASGSSTINAHDSGSAQLSAAATPAVATQDEEQQPKAQLGLWSSAIIAQEREGSVTKRRWTVTERH